MTKHKIARFAAFAQLTLGLAACMMAQQTDDRNDPNLPGLISPRGLKIQWSNYVKGSPQVIFTTPEVPSGHQAHYIGWNEQGSWFMNNEDGHIYVWNLKENSLKDTYPRDKDIPQDVLAGLHNFKDDFLLTKTADTGDPNMPGLTSPRGLKIQWNNYDKGNPQVTMPGQDHGATYLGWNDQGSWLVGADDGKIYVWNLKQNSLTMVYKNYKLIPQETVASLKSNPLAAAKGTPQDTGPKQTGPKPVTPDTSRQAAFFGDATNPPQAVPGTITGSGASIENGVLTFTLADKSTASYKVVRPKVAQGAPGNTGAWIALKDGGAGILFTVNADNSVTGHELPAQLIQMMMQGSPSGKR